MEEGQKKPSEDDAQDGPVEIELLVDASLGYQLGPTVTKNKTPEETISPRELVTERELSGGRFYFQVRCQRPKFGLFRGRPACLVVLDNAFRTTRTGSRFKSAKISVAFEDATVVGLDPDDDDHEEAFELARPHYPKVLGFQPVHYRRHAPGHAVSEGSFTTTLGLSSPGEGAPVGVDAGVEIAKPILREGCHTIQGLIRGASSNRLEWSLDENRVTNSGVVPRFSAPVIISYTPGRKFCARVRVQALIEWRPLTWVAGERDDPLMFTSLLPPSGGTEQTQPSLDDIDLKGLCMLEGFGGPFMT